MRWNEVYVDASAARLGRREDVRQAVAEGRYDAEECAADDLVSVSVMDDTSQADMAVEAARIALDRSRAAHEDFSLVVHVTSSGFQGLDHWSPAAYIQSRTVGGQAPAIQMQQASNGGVAAIDLVAAHLTARPQAGAALITTSDKYQMPMFDRYRSDKGLPRGDGATALVLTRGPGVARLLSTTVISDVTHEGVYRGAGPWAAAAGERGWPIDMRRRLKEYLGTGVDVKDLAKALAVGQQTAMELAMGEAGVGLGDVARFVYPHAGRTVVDWDVVQEIAGIHVDQTNWELGRRLGHLGAGDQIAGLTQLLESGAVGPGDKVVLSSLGHGYTFGCAVLEIVAEPQWSGATV
ncbi:3-oxoacyl-ACP synthase [Streptomyces sp. 150FB]|uniref:ketoacyl-ACP synthase III family protein n=1 Tax=Streptomyces sp. 150FB TaxID=1576605 RepID=UPI0005895787|nr:ketoacyl-ACP synthase III family protein [Streptomyces sp. 150FB]KIF72833.1 3-oxoacyl-ACP synthase [Streptomyces sp. 150FB]